MRIFPYGNRGGDCDDVALLNEQLSCLVAQFSNFGLGYWTTSPKLGDSSETDGKYETETSC